MKLAIPLIAGLLISAGAFANTNYDQVSAETKTVSAMVGAIPDTVDQAQAQSQSQAGEFQTADITVTGPCYARVNCSNGAVAYCEGASVCHTYANQGVTCQGPYGQDERWCQ